MSRPGNTASRCLKNAGSIAITSSKWPWMGQSFTIRILPSRSITWALISPGLSVYRTSSGVLPSRICWRISGTQRGHRESVSRGQPSGGLVFSQLFNSGLSLHFGVKPGFCPIWLNLSKTNQAAPAAYVRAFSAYLIGLCMLFRIPPEYSIPSSPGISIHTGIRTAKIMDTSALVQSIGRGRHIGLPIVIKMLNLLVVWRVAGLNGRILTLSGSPLYPEQRERLNKKMARATPGTRANELTPSPKSLFEAAQAKANQTQCAPDKREGGRLRCAVYYKRIGADRSARLQPATTVAEPGNRSAACRPAAKCACPHCVFEEEFAPRIGI